MDNVRFFSNVPNVNAFIQMARLLDNLRTADNDAEKVDIIKAAMNNGHISLEEAMDLYDEFVFERR